MGHHILRIVMSRARYALGCVVCVLAVALAGCGADSEPAANSTPTTPTGDSTASGVYKKPINILYIGYAGANTFTNRQLQALEEVASKYNATITFGDPNFDAKRQVSFMQDAVTTMKYDGVIVIPITAPSLVPAAEEAIKAGIKVAAVHWFISRDPEAPEPGLDVVSSIVMNPSSDAKIMATSVNTACEGINPCKLGMVWGNLAVPIEAVYEKYVKEYLDDNVVIVSNQEGQWDRATSAKVTKDMLQANPDLHVVACTGDDGTQGAELGVKSSGFEVAPVGTKPGDGKIAICGNQCTYYAAEQVRAGMWYPEAVLMCGEETQKALELIANVINGIPVSDEDKIIYQEELSPIGPVMSQETLEGHEDLFVPGGIGGYKG